MKLVNVFNDDILADMISRGYVSERKHPTLPLVVLNYTKQAQFDREWNAITTQCRGLVYDYSTGDVVARPLSKFFNYGEPDAPVYDMDDPVTVMDKADGSLIIAFQYDGQTVCCTRGSFESEQAVAAQSIFNERRFLIESGLTGLFELVGPSNRIVLAYPRDELVFLGGVETETGIHHTANEYNDFDIWDGGFTPVKVFDYKTFGEALAAPPRKNAEGFVIVGDKGMVKLKQEDYVSLHRLVTGLNERSVWEAMQADTSLNEFLEALPEEFHEWATEVWDNIDDRAMSLFTQSYTVFDYLNQKHESRRDFAIEASSSPYRPWLFMLLDGKPIYNAILSTLKPKIGDMGRTFV